MLSCLSSWVSCRTSSVSISASAVYHTAGYRCFSSAKNPLGGYLLGRKADCEAGGKWCWNIRAENEAPWQGTNGNA
jgi:hypothetical protein